MLRIKIKEIDNYIDLIVQVKVKQKCQQRV